MELIRSTNDTTIQASALRALGSLGDERTRPLVLDLLGSRTRLLRMSAIEALGRIAGTDAAERLTPFLMEGSREEMDAAARALAAIGTKGVDVLKEFASKEDYLTAAIAWEVLEEYGHVSSNA